MHVLKSVCVVVLWQVVLFFSAKTYNELFPKKEKKEKVPAVPTPKKEKPQPPPAVEEEKPKEKKVPYADLPPT